MATGNTFKNSPTILFIFNKRMKKEKINNRNHIYRLVKIVGLLLSL